MRHHLSGISMLQTLQAGRALAAISVAAFHLSVMMGVDRYGGVPVFQEFTKHGSRGVDFFFVLSGFIILFAHVGDIGKPRAWGEYIYRRFVRLYPIYWLYTAGFVALLALGFGTQASLPTGLGDWLSTVTLIRFSDGSPPITVAWTLFHEVAFYAAFSLLILNKRLGVAFFAIATCVCLALYQYPDTGERGPFNTYTAAYNLFFLLGMGAYWLFRRGGRGVAEFVAGAAIFGFALLTMGLPYQLSPLLLAIGLAFLVAGATKLERGGAIKVPVFLSFIGNASYTIYLVHIAVEGLLLKIALKTHLYQAVGAQVTYLLVLAATIGAGCVAYVLVERPLLTYLQARHKRRRAAAQALATA
jgi:exopolysaccharide production protein ExoZ